VQELSQRAAHPGGDGAAAVEDPAGVGEDPAGLLAHPAPQLLDPRSPPLEVRWSEGVASRRGETARGVAYSCSAAKGWGDSKRGRGLQVQ
jgi:hypothetical protein